MAEFDFRCPRCGKILSIDEAHQGKKTTCPSCYADIVIPAKPADTDPQPKIVTSPQAGAAGLGDLLPQDEKDVLSLRPTLKAFLGQVILAILIPVMAIVLAIVIKAGATLDWIIVIIGLAIGLILFIAALYKKYSIRYRLSTQRLFFVRGLISRKIEELELFRVRDIQVAQSLWERILNYGKMTVFSTDATSPKFEMSGIANPLKVKDMIRVHFRTARLRERVRPTEFISDFEPDVLPDKDPSL